MGVGLSGKNDPFDGYNMFGVMCFICLIGVYDNQMDRSRQEFAAMYDVRVRFAFDSHIGSFQHWLLCLAAMYDIRWGFDLTSLSSVLNLSLHVILGNAIPGLFDFTAVWSDEL